MANKKMTILLRICLFLNLLSFGVSKPMPTNSEIESINTVIDQTEIGDHVNAITDEEGEQRAKYAQQMMTYMNGSVDPCDDFYEFACGNWKNVMKERQAPHKRNNLLDIIYSLGEAAEALLQKSPSDIMGNYSAEFQLMQQFFQKCLSAELYPTRKSPEYLEVIRAIGGFPAVDREWRADNFSWFNMSAHMSNYGVSNLVNEKIMPQYPFPPYFQLPELGFDLEIHYDNIAANTSRGYLLNEKRMRDLLTIYGVAEARISQIISDIFEFLQAVLKVFEQFDEDLNQCQVLSELLEIKEFPQWRYYFEIAWMGKDFNTTDDDCPCNYFYNELDVICNERKEAVANYLALKFLYHMDARLSDKKHQREFCVISVHRSLPYLFDKLYMSEYFNEDIHKEVTSIIAEIRASLRAILEKADWLDETTRAEALRKESTIVSHIGRLEDPQMTDRLIHEMRNLSFVEGSYERNYLNLQKFKTLMRRYNGLHHEELNSSTKPLELLIGMQVNSFYYNIDNAIYVMAGTLQPPVYHKSWPNSLKFGTLGYLVGHEFTHGFDTVGAQYDSQGDARYWWSNKSGKVFDERSNCYVDHYKNYVIPEINRNINGNQTKDENIADSGGLREAMDAYRRYMKNLNKQSPTNTVSSKDEQMPGLELSPEQLFFLGFAQLWCSSYKEEHYWEELSNDHTIDKYRVLGAVTNIDDFATAYKCPLGSRMHPNSEKCQVW